MINSSSGYKLSIPSAPRRDTNPSTLTDIYKYRLRGIAEIRTYFHLLEFLRDKAQTCSNTKSEACEKTFQTSFPYFIYTEKAIHVAVYDNNTNITSLSCTQVPI